MHSLLKGTSKLAACRRGPASLVQRCQQSQRREQVGLTNLINSDKLLGTITPQTIPLMACKAELRWPWLLPICLCLRTQQSCQAARLSTQTHTCYEHCLYSQAAAQSKCGPGCKEQQAIRSAYVLETPDNNTALPKTRQTTSLKPPKPPPKRPPSKKPPSTFAARHNERTRRIRPGHNSLQRLYLKWQKKCCEPPCGSMHRKAAFASVPDRASGISLHLQQLPYIFLECMNRVIDSIGAGKPSTSAIQQYEAQRRGDELLAVLVSGE